MYHLIITERIKIVNTCYKNIDFGTVMYRTLKGDYGSHNYPTMRAIGKILKKFEETGVVTNIIAHSTVVAVV